MMSSTRSIPCNRIDSCPLGLAEHGVELCPMHSQLDETLEQIEQTLRSTTIADLLNPARRRKRPVSISEHSQQVIGQPFVVMPFAVSRYCERSVILN